MVIPEALDISARFGGSDDYETAAIWTGKTSLYQYIIEDPDTLGLDTIAVLTTFKDSTDTTNIGRLFQIGQISGRPAEFVHPAYGNAAIEEALEAAEELTPLNVVEEHLKEIYSLICLNYIDSIDSLSGTQIENLREIAVLCPYTDGPGVYFARAILQLVDTPGTNYTNDCEYVTPEPESRKAKDSVSDEKISRQENHQGLAYKIYPNPSSGSVHVEVNIKAEDEGVLEITDVLGRKNENYKLNTGYNYINVPTETFSEGVYTFTIRSGKNAVIREKVIIIR